jgi:transposase
MQCQPTLHEKWLEELTEACPAAPRGTRLAAATRIEQRTPEWKQLYGKRAGIEGTISKGVRSVGLRRPRYRGLSKTHLQNITVACAINLQRLADYWLGVPPAATRTSAFARIGEWAV